MRPNTIKDFWRKVKKQDGCWPWLAGKDQDGYGLFNWNNKLVRAIRFVAKEVKGLEIVGLVVRHTCDNPCCVNPDHLVVGTHADNEEDKNKRGRGLTGSTQSQEHIINKANARRGKKWTPEMKARMSRIKLGLEKKSDRPIRNPSLFDPQPIDE